VFGCTQAFQLPLLLVCFDGIVTGKCKIYFGNSENKPTSPKKASKNQNTSLKIMENIRWHTAFENRYLCK